VEATDLAKLYTAPSPFVSVYLDARPVADDLGQRLEQRWRRIRTGLSAAKADPTTIAAVEAAIGSDASSGASTQVLFASTGSVVYSRYLPEPVGQQLGWVGSLPYVAPLLSWAQTRVPHVVVLADRTGADILAYTDRAEPVSVDEVQGSHDELRKVRAGGWSHMRYQHRAVDSWEHNMREAAEQAGRVADDIKARLILLNGDVRAVALLRDHLPVHLAGCVEVIDAGGGRAVDGSTDVVAARVLDRVAAAAEANLQSVIDKFEEERGQHDRAADGVKATVAALMKAQVATLLLQDDSDDERRAWWGPDATQVALDRQTLLDMGVEQPREARLTDALVRAAVGTGAVVRIVPPDTPGAPKNGVGAILRYH
jgi:hypothetical protein